MEYCSERWNSVNFRPAAWTECFDTGAAAGFLDNWCDEFIVRRVDVGLNFVFRLFYREVRSHFFWEQPHFARKKTCIKMAQSWYTQIISIPNVVYFAVTIELIFVQRTDGVNHEPDGTRENVSTRFNSLVRSVGNLFMFSMIDLHITLTYFLVVDDFSRGGERNFHQLCRVTTPLLQNISMTTIYFKSC